MRRFIGVGVAAVGCAVGLACGGSDGSGDVPPVTPGTDAAVTDAPVTPSDGSSVDAAVDAADGALPVDTPVTVLSTTEEIRDISVLDGKLYLLLTGATRVETCDAAACTTRAVRIDNAHMPPEKEQVPLTLPSNYYDKRILAMKVGAGDGVVVVQEGNMPTVNASALNPAVYGFGPDANTDGDYLYRLTSTSVQKAADDSVTEDSRGSYVWVKSRRNNEAGNATSMQLLWFAPTAGGDKIQLVGSRVDTEGLMRIYDGRLVAGAHRSGAPVLSRSGSVQPPAHSPTDVFLVDTTTAVDVDDSSLAIPDPTWLGTTASYRFIKNASTPAAGQLLRSTNGAAGTTIVTMPSISAAHTLVGTELALLWYIPATAGAIDAGGGGPLTFIYCKDAELAGASCNPRAITLELDEVIRFKDDGPYLYALGRRSGKNVVVRFKP
jgi:hypothetical protein